MLEPFERSGGGCAEMVGDEQTLVGDDDDDGGGGGGAVHCSCSVAQRGIVCFAGIVFFSQLLLLRTRRETRKRERGGWETSPAYDDDQKPRI